MIIYLACRLVEIMTMTWITFYYLFKSLNTQTINPLVTRYQVFGQNFQYFGILVHSWYNDIWWKSHKCKSSGTCLNEPLQKRNTSTGRKRNNSICNCYAYITLDLLLFVHVTSRYISHISLECVFIYFY